MSQVIFPTLAGLEYPVKRTPEWKTLTQEATSGLEARSAPWTYPRWHWEVSYSKLSSAQAAAEFQTLVDFFNARQGQYDTFLYSDPDDNAVTNQQFGVGDGTTTAFQLTRQLVANGFSEPIFNVNGVPVIKDAGVIKTAGADYTISAAGVVTFTYTPTAGHALTWTGAYYFRCRFEDDQSEFNLFLYQLYENKKVRFMSVKGS